MFRRGKENLNTPNVQPGSTMTDGDEETVAASPIQMKAIDEKRELRDLNHRLEMFVRYRQNERTEIERLKKTIADQEVTFRQKVKENEQQFRVMQDELRKENETLNVRNSTLKDENSQAMRQRDSAENRALILEESLTRKIAELELKDKQIKPLQEQLEQMTHELIAYKTNTKNESQTLHKLRQQMDQYKNKFESTCEELAQVKSRHKCEVSTYTRNLAQKNEELDKLRHRVSQMEKHKKELESKVRQEFDSKMQEFIAKREEQYEQEKHEWMRIFKEEFNAKIRKYKEANLDLSHNNKKLEEDTKELRSRIARLKKQKAELEVSLRTVEEEYEKARSDLDDLRLQKDDEIKRKNNQLLEFSNKYKQKEIAFSELLASKCQLDREISLYRKILSDAEKDAGYQSPLASRKKRKMNNGEAQVLVQTPGLARGRQLAMKDLSAIDTDNESLHSAASVGNNNGSRNVRNKRKRKHPEADEQWHRMQPDQEHKDSESDYVTPGEAYPIQFSTMDLCRSTLEIQNISESPISLDGYVLTNSNKDALFRLPQGRSLKPNERVKIVVGTNEIAGEHDLWWCEDVWTGLKDDVARLYNPQNQEIARIEICPEMLPDNVRSRKGCLIM